MLSVLLAAPDDPGEAAAGLPELLHALSVVKARMAAEAAIAVERMNALRLMASLSLLSVGLSDVEAVIRGLVMSSRWLASGRTRSQRGRRPSQRGPSARQRRDRRKQSDSDRGDAPAGVG